MDQYKDTTVNFLFKSYINIVYKRYYCAPTDETLTTQEYIGHGVTVSSYEGSIKDIKNKFLIPVVLPWPQVDKVYIPVNCS